MSSSAEDIDQPPGPPKVPQRKFRLGNRAILQFAGTRTGLKLVWLGMILLLIRMSWILFGLVLSFWTSVEPGTFGLRILQLGEIVTNLLLLAGGVMVFVGQCFCLTVPPATGAKRWVVMAVALQVISALLAVAIGVGLALSARDANFLVVIQSMQTVQAVGALVSFTCFLMFIKRVATFMSRTDLTDYANKVMAMFATFVALYLLMFIFILTTLLATDIGQTFLNRPVGLLGMAVVISCMGFVVLALGIGGLCMYVLLLNSMVQAIDERISDQAQKLADAVDTTIRS